MKIPIEVVMETCCRKQEIRKERDYFVVASDDIYK
jgi:hypothetical protein